MNLLKKIFKGEDGQTLSEYGLLLALIAVACILVMIFLGDQLAAKFRDVASQIQQAAPR
ncbi:MAG: Flp family type IVb pilin [Bacillota bacterium]|jgi:pilus assembly protein Flp/PilA|nr:Flp family type IVb pilin [Bacillota bacterium]